MYSLLVCILLCLGWAIQATALEIFWPTGPTVGDSPSVRWGDGTAPYTMYVHNLNTSTITYTYTGNDNITFWTVDVPSGTVIKFQVTDATSMTISSDPVTVLPNPLSASISESSVSVARLSRLSVSLYSASIASVASISSISVTSVGATNTNKANPGSAGPSGISPTGSSSNSKGGGNHPGAIVGAVVGSLLGVGFLTLGGFYLFMRRRKYSSIRGEDPDHNASSQMTQLPMKRSESLTPPGTPPPGFAYAPVTTSLPASSSYHHLQKHAYPSPGTQQMALSYDPPPPGRPMLVSPFETYQPQQLGGVRAQSDASSAQSYDFNGGRRGWAGLPEL